MSLIQKDHAIEAFPSDGSDDALDERRLPRTTEQDQELVRTYSLDPIFEDIPVDFVSVPEEIFRRGIPGKRLGDLLSSPLRSQMPLRTRPQANTWSRTYLRHRIGSWCWNVTKRSWSLIDLSLLLGGACRG